MPTELTVVVDSASPDEYDSAGPANNRRSATVDVTRDELDSARLVLESLGGYGFQFNGHVYAPITNAPPDTLPDLEAKVKALEPQLVRIFFNENWELNADGTHPEWQSNLDSFRRTVDLAQQSGATILVAYQGVARARLNPTLWMTRFADVLQDLVQGRGDTNVTWVTIGNEPNSSTALTLPQYEAMYRRRGALRRAAAGRVRPHHGSGLVSRARGADPGAAPRRASPAAVRRSAAPRGSAPRPPSSAQAPPSG